MSRQIGPHRVGAIGLPDQGQVGALRLDVATPPCEVASGSDPHGGGHFSGHAGVGLGPSVSNGWRGCFAGRQPSVRDLAHDHVNRFLGSFRHNDVDSGVSVVGGFRQMPQVVVPGQIALCRPSAVFLVHGPVVGMILAQLLVRFVVKDLANLDQQRLVKVRALILVHLGTVALETAFPPGFRVFGGRCRRDAVGQPLTFCP